MQACKANENSNSVYIYQTPYLIICILLCVNIHKDVGERTTCITNEMEIHFVVFKKYKLHTFICIYFSPYQFRINIHKDTAIFLYDAKKMAIKSRERIYILSFNSEL